MFLIVSKYLIPKGYAGMTFFPFIILKYKSYLANSTTINHEKIHIKQQLELLVLPFYFFYFLDFGFQYLRYRNINKAYRNICFEKEAYHNEKNSCYLKTRKNYAFLKYF